jgi:hypothetical protein
VVSEWETGANKYNTFPRSLAFWGRASYLVALEALNWACSFKVRVFETLSGMGDSMRQGLILGAEISKAMGL